MNKDFLKPPFGLKDVEILERESLYKGFFRMERLHYRHKRYRGDWSSTVSREVLFRGDAVGAVLYDPQHDLIGLVEQIRPGAFGDPNGPWCLEVVAGMVEPGETNEAVVWREMEEEAGLTPDRVEYICQYMASPGGCDERLHVFCATADLAGLDGSVNGLENEGEDIRLLIIPAESVFAELYSGRFNNAATMISLQWLQMNRSRLREG
ncbi:NUDIX domain-containing protein [Aestuariicella hydrocarbonica]|uniref:ADP-ribose pyrophosphatase n=1 Tax=Pseudomaricurvus hydrocarbonicus TaxID=1470433 RepID=A0A9E5JVU5_9GAMM|nr:NUDIX domain-containing protein [Aestuariicella hydrocarbonica]NHO66523.1 NUDIX domain-containing protein [Aestuariicella hydrocarbonica]